MKKLLTCLALSLVAASSYAATPLWLRDVQISPDGTETVSYTHLTLPTTERV